MITEKQKATQRDRIAAYLYTVPGATRNEIHKATGILVQTLCHRLPEMERMRLVTGSKRRKCSVTKAPNIEYRLHGAFRNRMARAA